uniref:Uncharacterized protein n=1 Tax=Parascaris univalens TaxID=6257 RepID=A0A915AQ72_PARUN
MHEGLWWLQTFSIINEVYSGVALQLISLIFDEGIHFDKIISLWESDCGVTIFMSASFSTQK